MLAVPSAAMVVTAGDTAEAFRSGDVPVLATPRVLALCEEATMAAVAGSMGGSDTTVAAFRFGEVAGVTIKLVPLRDDADER